ncbi:MAG: alpha/beta fold hydrolase [Pseudomonadota bacterium]
MRFLLLFAAFLSMSASGNEPAPLQFAEFDACALTSGETLAPCRVGYRTYGTLNADQSNVVLVPTWHTGKTDAHVFLASPDVIDPERYFIIMVDALANGVSSSPSNHSKTQAGDFPTITIADMVDTQHRLLTEHLGIDSLHAVMGISMGGMQTFEWVVRYPDFADRAVAVIGSTRLPTFDIAFWTARIQTLKWFRDCDRCEDSRLAMQAMWMTALVPTKLSEEVAREQTMATIEKRAEDDKLTIAESWDIQRQAEAMNTHNVARDFDNDMTKAAARVSSDLLIIVGTDDRVVTPEPAKAFATLTEAALIEFDKDCGHGEPGCNAAAFNEAVRLFLRDGADKPAASAR